MTNSPGNGNPGEGPEFGWLYGRPGNGSQEPPPEATRKIPVQPRPDQGPPGQSGPPTQNLGRRLPPPGAAPQPPAPHPQPYQQPYQQPGQPPSQQPRRGGGGGGFWAHRLRRPGFYVRTFLVLLLLWVTYTVAVPFISWEDSNQISFDPSGDRPAAQDGTTYLIVGSDSRANLSKEQRQELSTGNPNSDATDTLMLFHTGSGPSVLVSIPRDSEVPGSYGAADNKINGLYAVGGYPLLVKYLESSTGIRIDNVVEIGLGGVAEVVDAVGGVSICPERRMVDERAGLRIRKGCQTVDGTTALAYSRSRYSQKFSDLDRVKHQREVVAAIGKKVLSPWTVVNPVRWWRINHAVPSIFRFGEGTGKIDAGRWALAMAKPGKTCTVPVAGLTSPLVWDRDRADPLFAAIADDNTDDITTTQCTATGLK